MLVWFATVCKKKTVPCFLGVRGVQAVLWWKLKFLKFFEIFEIFIPFCRLFAERVENLDQMEDYETEGPNTYFIPIDSAIEVSLPIILFYFRYIFCMQAYSCIFSQYILYWT